MNLNITEAHKLLEARLEDMLERSRRGELVCGNFLTPAEVSFCRALIKQRGEEKRSFFYGGYADADRKRLYILPQYLMDIEGDSEEKLRLYCAEEFCPSVAALSIKGSGYRKLSHRDYLGSILALGIERHALGDVIVTGDSEAIVICTDKISAFLLEGVDKVASDKVTVSKIELFEDFAPKREVLPVSDTVASNRFDCVVGALTNLSREKAQAAIRTGLCEVDYLPEQRCDVSLATPCIVTVRGYGKYRLLSFDGETKRGRLRLKAEKYI